MPERGGAADFEIGVCDDWDQKHTGAIALGVRIGCMRAAAGNHASGGLAGSAGPANQSAH